MARNQSNRGKSPNSYNQPPKNNKIQKNPKKDNSPQHNNFPKPQPSNTNNPNTKLSFPPPTTNPVPNKPLTQAGKNNLAKLASINQLMGVPTNSAQKTPKPMQNSQPMSSKSSIKKPSPQQVAQTLESLKDLEKLLDSYDELEMDQSSNLKSLLEFLQQRKVNTEQQKEKEKQEKTIQ